MPFFQFLRKNYARRRLIQFLHEHATKERTLDIGCGNSPYIELFPNRIGVDSSPTAHADIIGDVYDLPFEDGSFKSVLCTELLEHLSEPQKAVDEIHRVLSTPGKLILTTRFLYPRHGEPQDYFRYTPEGLRHLLRHFSTVSIEPELQGIQSFAVLLEAYALEQDAASFTWGRVGRTIILFLALISSYVGAVTSREKPLKGDAQAISSSTLASGYYVVAYKN